MRTYLKTLWWALLRRPVIAYCHFYETLPLPQGSPNVLVANNLLTAPYQHKSIGNVKE